MYSIAVMFFEMAVGKIPDVTSNTYVPFESGNDTATLELLQFMLKMNSAERPSAEECANRIDSIRDLRD
jgi:hypothetical protein